MAQAVGSFIAKAGVWFVDSLIAIGFSQGTAIAILDFGIKLAALAGLNKLSESLIGEIDDVSSAESFNQTVRSTIAHQRIIYGETIASGPLWYINTSGDNNEILWQGVMLAGHEIEDITDVWLDDVEIPSGYIDWASTGDVTSGDFRGNIGESPVCNFKKFLGTPNQSAPADLVSAFTEITSQHQGRNIAWLQTKFTYVESQSQVWSAGPPNNIKPVVKGKKVYDPRSDSSQSFGTGPHRVNSDATWEWSDNPALCWADWKIDQRLGFKTDPSRIDYSYVASAAEICDGIVYTPVGTDKRYRCNGILSTGDTDEQNEKRLLSAMNGRVADFNGSYKIRAAAYTTPTLQFNDDVLKGNVSIKLDPDEADRFNTVRARFIDKDRLWQESQAPEATSSEYISRDNDRVLYRDVNLHMTKEVYAAQRLMIGILEQSDLETTAILPTNFKTLPTEVGGTIGYSNEKMGWVNKDFLVSRYKLSDMGGIDLVVREEESTAYTDVGTADYIVSSQGGYVINDPGVPPTTGFTATGVAVGIKLAWTNPAARLFEFVDIYEAATNSWGDASRIASVRGNTLDINYDGGEERWFWNIVRNYTGEESTRNPNTGTSTVTATAGVGGGGADGDDAITVVYTNNNHTVPVTNLGVEDWNGSGGLCYVFEGTTKLTLGSNTQSTNFAAINASEFLIDIAPVSGDTLTGEPAITGSGTTTATLGDWSGNLTQVTVYRITISLKTADSTEITIEQDVTLSPGDQGDDGADGVDSLAISYTNNAHTPTVDNAGVEDWTGSGGLFYAYDGATVLTLNQNAQTGGVTYPGTDGRYNLDITPVSGDTLTEPAITGSGTTTATLGNWGSDLTQTTVYRITAYIRKLDSTTFSLTTDVTISPADQGADGADGRPGLPGASTLCAYDNADSDGSSSSQGRYHFLTSITNTSGTFVWSTITTASGVDYLSWHKDSTGGTTDYTSFYDTVEIGDTVTWHESDGRWVSFEVTSIPTAPTDMFKVGVSYIIHDETDGSGNVNSDAGNDVTWRWSRATIPTAPGVKGVGAIAVDIDATTASAGIRVDNDGGVDKFQGDGAAYTSIDDWLISGSASDYDVMFEGTGDTPSGSAVNTWLNCGTDRSWTLTNTTGGTTDSFEGTLKWRDATTYEILAQAAATVEAEVSA